MKELLADSTFSQIDIDTAKNMLDDLVMIMENVEKQLQNKVVIIKR
jgi:hypothetical protein